MRARLTKTEIGRLDRQGKLDPGGSFLEVRDTELKGLLLRIRPTGQRAWFYQYRTTQGRQTRIKLGDFQSLSPDGARALAKERSAEVSKGADPVAVKRAAKAAGERAKLSTLRSFVENRYEPWATANLKSAKAQHERLMSDFAKDLDRPMSDFHQVYIEGIRQRWKREGLSPSSINRDLQRLQSVLSKAVSWGVLERHPFSGVVKPLKTDKAGRVRFLEDSEEKALRRALLAREARIRRARASGNKWRAARGKPLLAEMDGQYADYLRPIVLVALNTGMRRGELLGLKWSDVSFGNKLVTVTAATAKSGQTRRLPLNTEALEVLTTWRAQHKSDPVDAHVFKKRGERLLQINVAWTAVTKAAGLPDFHFHDCRHHFASRLVQAGVDLNTVRELLGHSEIAMTLRYAHLAASGLASAVQKIG
jgi:integrase